jgi:TolA-binding protein
VSRKNKGGREGERKGKGWGKRKGGVIKGGEGDGGRNGYSAFRAMLVGTVMNLLLTVFTLVLTSASAVFGYVSWKSAEESREIADDLRRALSRVSANEAEVQTLTAQIHKLRGKIYSMKPEKQEIEIADRAVLLGVCENYAAAQTDGPGSKAARCDCPYCEAKRRERDELRARLVPKTNAERRHAIEKGKH